MNELQKGFEELSQDQSSKLRQATRTEDETNQEILKIEKAYNKHTDLL